MAKKNPFEMVDKYITDKICMLSTRFTKNDIFMNYMQFFEYSCHGISWVVITLLSVWLFWARSLFQAQVNLLIGLVLDIIVVALLKATFRRKRPVLNSPSKFEFGPDVYSFPSGHVSRAFLVLYFFRYLFVLNEVLNLIILFWSFGVVYSRIVLRKHYLADVFVGILVGLCEGVLLSYLWVTNETAIYMIEWLTNDNFIGADYHV